MSDGELPLVPTDPTVIHLSEYNAPRTCDVCNGDADFYVIVTNEAANDRLDVDLACDEWPVNSFLCADDFKEAPRAEDWEALVDAAV